MIPLSLYLTIAILGFGSVAGQTVDIVLPLTAPSNASSVDPSLLSVSIEFFAFPGYTDVSATATCLNNLAELRGAPPAVRIGGTTQYADLLSSSSLSALTYYCL